MTVPDEQPNPVEPGPGEESPSKEELFPETPDLPEDFTPIGGSSRLPRARRRRAHRMLVRPGADERAALLDSLARRAFPSFEFFLFAFFAGVVLGVGYLLDMKVNSQAIFLLGILLAPLLTPWVGMTLAGTTGSWRFFFMTLGVMLVASLLVFLTGALAGLAGRLWLPHPPFFQADIRSHIWWLDLFIVALGAALLTISFVRSEQKPILPSMIESKSVKPLAISATLMALSRFADCASRASMSSTAIIPGWACSRRKIRPHRRWQPSMPH